MTFVSAVIIVCDNIKIYTMNLSLKSLKDSLMQTSAAEAISEKAILASHVSYIILYIYIYIYIYLISVKII